MQIKILRGVNSAKEAEGIAVVIDVFRAFSAACYFFDKGVRKIIPVKTIEEARRIKQNYPGVLLAGEKEGRVPDDFNFGNSPSEIAKKENLKGKVVVHTTTLGTVGLINATESRAKEVITGAFVNAQAIADYILKNSFEKISLVATADDEGEDYLCAQYIKDLLKGKNPDFNSIYNFLRKSSHAVHFFDPKITSHPEEDFYYCMRANEFNFVLRAEEDSMFKRIVLNPFYL